MPDWDDTTFTHTHPHTQVMERMVERYLSMAHPLRRYEFMSQIKWQNSQLHDDLIGSEIIVQVCRSVRV